MSATGLPPTGRRPRQLLGEERRDDVFSSSTIHTATAIGTGIADAKGRLLIEPEHLECGVSYIRPKLHRIPARASLLMEGAEVRSLQFERLHWLPRDISDQFEVFIHSKHRKPGFLGRGGDQ